VVDEEPLIRFGLTKSLMKIADVKAVGSVVEALDEIGAQRYDLCFLDIVFHKMTGYDELKAINRLAPNMEVAIMTGSFLEEDVKGMIKDGTFALIEKPFNLSQIIDVADRVSANLTEKVAFGKSKALGVH